MGAFDPEKDYYAALGVPVEASEEEIKVAYRDLARRYHPDSGGDAERFRQIQEAYEILRDPTLHRAYDRQRESRGLSQESPLVIGLTLNRTNMQPLEVPQMLYVLVDIRPRVDLPSQRLPLNLALVIDRSTSMQGVRMENVKLAALDLVESLLPGDRLSLVAFSDRAEVIASGLSVSDKRALRSAISALMPGGGTEICRGLTAGLDELRRYVSDQYLNHLILLTDGRTYGDEEQSLSEVRRAGAQKIGISALGIGEDWNDLFLDALARQGGGICQYIRSPSQVRQLLRDQIRGLSAVVARQVRLVINPAPNVKIQAAFRAAPYMEYLTLENGTTLKLGNMGVDEPIALILDLVVQQPEPGERRLARLELEAATANDTAVTLQLRRDLAMTFSYSAQDEPVPGRLLNMLSRLSIFRLQERAWELAESGDVQQATNMLQAAATRLFDLGYKELAQVALTEVGRLSAGGAPTSEGRKRVRYGTRSLTSPV